MEQFEVILVGDTLTVVPHDNNSYTIFKGQEVLGTIWPDLDDTGVNWSSEDMTKDQAMQIGELIEEHDM